MRTTRRVRGLRWGVVLGTVMVLSACGEDIGLSPAPDDPTPPDANNSRVKSTQDAEGTWTTVVDATSSAAWVGVDLDTRTEVDAARDEAWDLAFQRFHVRTRGGPNGSGGVAVAVLENTDFDTLRAAPADGYQQDRGGDSAGTRFEADGDGWYDYEPSTHKLSPKAGRVYVVHGDQGRYFKLQLVSYYDAAGTSGWMRFRWAELSAPSRP
jgi:hypothetical protein